MKFELSIAANYLFFELPPFAFCLLVVMVAWVIGRKRRIV